MWIKSFLFGGGCDFLLPLYYEWYRLLAATEETQQRHQIPDGEVMIEIIIFCIAAQTKQYHPKCDHVKGNLNRKLVLCWSGIFGGGKISRRRDRSFRPCCVLFGGYFSVSNVFLRVYLTVGPSTGEKPQSLQHWTKVPPSSHPSYHIPHKRRGGGLWWQFRLEYLTGGLYRRLSAICTTKWPRLARNRPVFLPPSALHLWSRQ